MNELFKKISKLIWKKHLKNAERMHISAYSKDTYNMLAGLNPGKEGKTLVEEFYLKKIENMILFTVVGSILLLALLISELTDNIPDEENRLARNDYGESKYETTLIATSNEEEYEVTIDVSERIYREEELDILAEECIKELGVILCADNPGPDNVTGDLNTVKNVEGYPFSIVWETRNYGLIHADGVLGDEKPDEEGSKCELIAILTYRDHRYEHSFNLTIYPIRMTEDEKILNEIIASVQQKQEETQYDAYLQLPLSNNAGPISWKKPCSPLMAMLATLLVLALLGIWIGIDNDLAKKYRKRNQLLSLEYSEFVSKLQLLIGSGMTLRAAFERMGEDYKLLLKEGEKPRYVYDELLLCNKRMRDGASQEECYDYFGRKCNLMNYKKLMTLLIQNLQKGSTGLMSALNYESKVAFEERKQIARRMGEEAQTKLLFPMMIMLGIVMIIIIVPAYASFGA
ncbi:MAG: type II secretion system F family protein [Lachnospiraceae bacterium]|nr:type II secretion system F family protein [Lachnospiraceae bacterium]